MKKILQYYWLAMILFTPWSLFGQIALRKGVGFPKTTANGTWYLDTLNHTVWNKPNTKWMELRIGEVRDVIECQDNVAFLGSNGYWVYTNAGRLVDSITGCECLGQIMRVGYEGQHRYIQGSTTLAWEQQYRPMSDSPLPPYSTSIQGISAYCLTSTSPSPNIFIYDWRVHYWGMLGTNGKWLIEPLFDDPFVFQNGIADVLYYGQKRKINEKGEFVE
jgi:hypothetical protein